MRPVGGRRMLGPMEPLASSGSSPRISLCVIARNEEASLARCLASAAPFVDELVVVDTGSTDRTVEIARAGGAVVGHFTWCDDFAAARNAALELAGGDWILSLDADEVLDQATAPNLRALARAAAGRLRCYGLLIRNHGPGEAPDSAAGGRETLASEEATEIRHFGGRFFCRHPHVRWIGSVHEVVAWTGPATGEPPLEYVLTDQVAIDHFGYATSDEARRAKLERNVALLRRAIEREPEEGYYALKLGQHYLSLGQLAEARAWLERACRLARQAASRPRYAAQAYQALLSAWLEALADRRDRRAPGDSGEWPLKAHGRTAGDEHGERAEHDERGEHGKRGEAPLPPRPAEPARAALAAAEEAVAHFPQHPWLWYQAGRLHELLGEPRRAREAYARSLVLAGRAGEYALPPASLAAPARRLGRLALEAGEPAAASQAFQQALVWSPGDREALLGAAEAQLAAGQPAEAAQRLERLLVATGPRDSLCAWLGECRIAAGDLQRAYDELWATLQEHPEFTQARLTLARLLHQAGEPQAALATLAPLLDSEEPAPRPAYALLAALLDRLGRPEDAARARLLAASAPDAAP